MELEQLGPFKIGRVLGRGGMGAVYESAHEVNGTVAAVKVLLSTLEDDAEIRLRFEAEINTLKRLRHPNIVRLFGFGEEQGVLYYVMEYVDGPSLQNEIKKQRLFQWHEVAKIGLDVASALKHAHDRGIIHRDIKPANILLTQDGTVKLADYGIAQFFGSSRMTEAHSIVGTLEFMSPEQAQANPIGPRSDLFTLGTVLYLLLVGKTPFTTRSLPELLRKHHLGEYPPISTARLDVPEDLVAVINDCLRILPEYRPANAYLVVKRLQSVLQALIGQPDDIFVFPMSENTPRQPIAPEPAKVHFDGDFSPTPNIKHAQGGMVDDGIIDLGGLAHTQTQRKINESERAVTESFERVANLIKPHVNDFEFGDGISNEAGTMTVAHREAERDHPTDFYHHNDETKETAVHTPPLTPVETVPIRHGEVMLDGVSALRSSKDDPMTPIRVFDAPLQPPADFPPPSSQKKQITERESKSQKENNAKNTDLNVSALKTLESSKVTRTFVEVNDEELDEETVSFRAQPLISIPTILASFALIIIGITVFFLLQPVPPDTLYERITGTLKQDDSLSGYSLSTLRDARENIGQFLALYPGHSLAEQVRALQDELELAEYEHKYERRHNLNSIQKLSPVEVAYVETIGVVRNNPAAGIVKLRAFISLFESGRETDNQPKRLSGPGDICIALAKRRLKVLQIEVAAANEELVLVLQNRLDDAMRLKEANPKRANEMCEGVIELYKDHPWAAKLVERANQIRDQ
ncbi:hypothetical protein FACS189454_06570 [Planctomycetales bacterium]|nr:hypothetical protein FACS189454_06570 [Planctomycetales bacterium]